MQQVIKDEGESFALAPWDWWYYAEKVRKAKYDLDENELRPYFVLDNVRTGAFEVARRLYGLQFVERKDIAVYNNEVTVFEVKREDGTHIGILYTDYFPRPGKQAGAWCGACYDAQERRGGTMVTPLVTNVGNFSRPAGDQPALLSPDEVGTTLSRIRPCTQCAAPGSDVQNPLRSRGLRGASLPDHGELGFRTGSAPPLRTPLRHREKSFPLSWRRRSNGATSSTRDS